MRLHGKTARIGLILATLLIGASFASPARAAVSSQDRVAQQLASSRANALKAELTGLAIANRDLAMVKDQLFENGLSNGTETELRQALPGLFSQSPKAWAKVYKALKAMPGAAAAAPMAPALRKAVSANDVAARTQKIATALGQMNGQDLDRSFDGSKPAKASGFWGDEGGNGGGDGSDTNPSGSGRIDPTKNTGNPDDKIMFKDVVGIDEALGELKEIVTMLKDPQRYQRVGADIPTGLLMAGPPGVGKTYSARALANEAGISCFISKSGPEFINKYVGQSAENVRATFAEARKNQPCIIFIDEIDALAGKRIDVQQGADHETNSAVTELLVQMDGLTQSPDGKKPLVIVVGATNRPDMLDPAVLRPGRFDRKITINLPDVVGRQKVLELYVGKKQKKGVQYAKDVNLAEIATKTTGMSPADLKNLVNEASLLAARDNVAVITQAHLEHAIDRVVIGHERNMVMSDEDKRQTAIHELGHALVTSLIPGGDPVGKITIIPRDTGAGGVTTTETGDRPYWTKEQILNNIAMSLGGRAAERLFLNTETTGPSSDLEHAKDLAKKMVVELGMSDAFGPVTFTQSDNGNYLEQGAHMGAVSEATSQKIDAEIQRIESEQEARATAILTAHKATLEKIVPTLMAKETLDGSELRALLRQIEPGNKDIQKEPENVAKGPSGNGSSNAITLAPILDYSQDNDLPYKLN